jgi:SpoVK/Ycf46/Vps4 family AAA+-type ATPase
MEKSMAGSDSSGKTDSGTTARVMQTILTWMQEKTQPVYVAATVNKVSAIPPELMRKGRFDEIFGVDLPVLKEREEIFAIHIKKRDRNTEDYDLENLGKNSEGYTGAEIEAAIDDAMATAFSSEDGIREFTTEDILISISETIPQSESQREQISLIREWITTRTRLVSSRNAPKWNVAAGKNLLDKTRKVRESTK